MFDSVKVTEPGGASWRRDLGTVLVASAIKAIPDTKYFLMASLSQVFTGPGFFETAGTCRSQGGTGSRHIDLRLMFSSTLYPPSAVPQDPLLAEPSTTIY